MLAIAISLLLIAVAAFACVTIGLSLLRGIAAGKAIVAEMAELRQGLAPASSAAFPPLRGHWQVSPSVQPRQPVRLRPLRPACAAA